MRTDKWAAAKLQGDKTASFCRDMSGREVTGGNKSASQFPWNSITHGFLVPSVFPDKFPQNLSMYVIFWGGTGYPTFTDFDDVLI